MDKYAMYETMFFNDSVQYSEREKRNKTSLLFKYKIFFLLTN